MLMPGDPRVLVAVLRDPKKYRVKPKILGFIRLEIKTFEVEHAPPYSRQGPYHKREFSYVDLLDKRWPVPLYHFINTEEDREVNLPTVILGPRDKDPEGMIEAPFISNY